VSFCHNVKQAEQIQRALGPNWPSQNMRLQEAFSAATKSDDARYSIKNLEKCRVMSVNVIYISTPTGRWRIGGSVPSALWPPIKTEAAGWPPSERAVYRAPKKRMQVIASLHVRRRGGDRPPPAAAYWASQETFCSSPSPATCHTTQENR